MRPFNVFSPQKEIPMTKSDPIHFECDIDALIISPINGSVLSFHTPTAESSWGSSAVVMGRLWPHRDPGSLDAHELCLFDESIDEQSPQQATPTFGVLVGCASPDVCYHSYFVLLVLVFVFILCFVFCYYYCASDVSLLLKNNGKK